MATLLALVGTAFAVWWGLVFGAAEALAQPPRVEVVQLDGAPISVSLERIEEDTLFLRVTNRSEHVVTAWSFKSIGTRSDGKPDGWESVTTDFCPGLLTRADAGSNDPGGDGVAPGAGETRIVEWRLGRHWPPLANRVITLSFVIFDDQSSVGDPGQIRGVFRDREEDLAAINAIARVARDTTASVDSLNRLEAGLTLLDGAATTRSIGDQVRRQIRNVIAAWRRGSVTAERAAEVIHGMIDRYVSRLERYAGAAIR
jgi:hypothetical protein